MKSDLISIVDLKRSLKYDPITGDFTWIIKKPGLRIGDIAGSVSTKRGYSIKSIMVDGKSYVAARLAWYYMTDKWPENQIDHINHNSTDNRWENLRQVTNQENARNRKPQKKNKSGMAGVVKVKGRWVSTIGIDGKVIILYSGDNFGEACKARAEANIKYGFHENHGL